MSNVIEAEVVTEVTEDSPLILDGSGYTLAIAPSYQKKKDELLKHAGLIVTISDSAADSAADIQIKALGAMRIEVEKSREAKKRPALDFGKLVDTTAKEFVEKIIAEETRLKKLRGDHAAAVLAERNRILREAEAKRLAEEKARLAEEAAEAARIEAERKAQEAAEKARRDAEEAAFNAVSPEEEAAAKAAAEEAQRKAEEAAKAEVARVEAAQARIDLIAATPPPAPTFIPEAPKGVKMVADYEVTDLDALYRHNAGLVILTERRKEILDAIARGMIGETPPAIPGLRVFMKAQVR